MRIDKLIGASAFLAGLTAMAATTHAASLTVDFQATISSQNNANSTGEGKYYHVSLIGPNPGTGSFCANIPGTNNPAPAFVRNYDGPVVAYKFAGGTNNDITSVSREGGDSGSITFATDDTAFDGFGQDAAKLWTTTDPGNDIAVGALLSASADTIATGYRDLGGAVCTIDVTAVSAGSVHFYYGNYNGKPTVSVVMRDLDAIEPDLTIADAHLNGDFGNGGEFYLAEIDFVTDGNYDEIEILFDANSTGDTINGNGRGPGVVVTSAVADAVDPTLASTDIVDDVSGGPFISTGIDSITYTVTYSELMDPATIDASDFGLGGTAAGTIDSVVHFGGVTTVVVTPTAGTSGTLVLQVNAAADIRDLAGNPLDTTSAIVDSPAVTIVADVTDPTLVSIADNVAGGPVLEGQTVTYTVTFDEPMKASTIGTDDFENGGSPAAVINSVNPTGDPAVYEVVASSAYPGGVGTLLLQIKAGAVLEDLSGNALDTSSALPDDTTITVNAQETRETVTVDSWLAIDPEQNDVATMTFDASGSDKLVVVATKEGNSSPYTLLTYEDEPLILAVSTGSDADNRHWQGIYYLDNPGSFDNGTGDVGEIRAQSGTNRNIVTAFALSNTAPGVGGVAAPPVPDNSKSVTLGLNFVGSAVIASHGMGQSGNTANVTSVDADAPLTETSAIERGNNWVGHVTGYATNQGPGFSTYSFTGGSTTGCNTIAAEFYGAIPSATQPFDDWSVLDGASGVTFEGDANGDGVKDGLAFLLGAANPNIDANAAGLLPTVTETSGGLVLTFNCLPTADRGTAELRVEHGSDLGVSDPWTATVDQVPDADDLTPDNGVTFVVTPGSPTNAVTATIDASQAAGGKLFGRLQATE